MDNASLVAAAVSLETSAKPREKTDRATVQVPVESLVPLLTKLRDKPELSFDMLMTHTAIDWVAQGQFELVYMLYSVKHGHYMMVTTSVPREKPVVPTVSHLWRVAEWHEREAYDLMGILYDGHQDLRRLFLEDDWKGFPLRKDYKDDYMLERPQ